MRLYRGDALRILPFIKADHFIFDPPYEETMHRAKVAGARNVRTDGGKPLKALAFKSIAGIRPVLLPLIKRGSRGGWVIAFCTPEGIAPWRDEIEAAGLRYKRACFWCKPDGAPQFNGQGPAYAVEPFVTAWAGGGVSRWNGGGGRNWWEIKTHGKDREGSQPTEKPVELMMKIIKQFTKPGDTICDPFMGSGTTVIAALATGRKVIGIEKDASVFKLARARIESELGMGREQGRRHIVKRMGFLRADAGPLFEEVRS